MKTYILDAETFYDKNGYTLSKLTPAEYILDSRFELIGMAIKELGAKSFWIEGPEVAAFFASLNPDETTTISHNALFDNAIWAYRYGFVPKLMGDTLGMARAVLNLKSNSLESVANYLKLGIKGQEIGQAIGLHLADLKARPDFYRAYIDYALNDALLCEQIYIKLNEVFPASESRIQDLVLRCAIEPVLRADVNLLEKHLESLRKRKSRLLNECDYDKAQLMSTSQFRDALEELGVVVKTKISPTGREVPQFAKSDSFMEELQEYNDSPNDDVNYKVQVLAAARLAHKSTIEETRCERFLNIAKLPWLRYASGQRCSLLPVPLRYGGAHTHRLSGEWRMNLQNLPREHSQLRNALRAPEGYKIISADLSQIEARIVARICEQQDLLQQFVNGEDVYANFASKLFNRPINKRDNPDERWIGKTAILGLGYGCGWKRFEQMLLTSARRYNIDLKNLHKKAIYEPKTVYKLRETDIGVYEEVKVLENIKVKKGTAEQTVDTYRNTFPRIRKSWQQLDRLLHGYLNNSNCNQVTPFGPVWIASGRIRLPNGLYLRYDVPDQTLYGAKLLENITQALARNVIMEAALRLADRGYRFVLQAHDELVFVVSDANVENAKTIILEELIKEPEWLPALPLAAEIGVGLTYGEAK